jgi:hypothetical protein
MRRKAIVLILGLIAIMVLIVLTRPMFSSSVSDKNITQRNTRMAQAFWLAEAGLNRALDELRSNYDQSGSSLWTGSLTGGEYVVDVAYDGDNRRVTVYGYSPSVAQAQVQRGIEAIMSKYIPPGFYDNALYTRGVTDINGSAYSVDGDVYTNTSDIEDPSNITGTVTEDSSEDPLVRFDFAQLRNMSLAQGYVYDELRLEEVKTGSDSFPSSYWYTRADDGVDNDIDGTIDEDDEWVPCIVYVESDLTLNGDIGTVAGFFVVVGDVITSPDESEDATINGNGQIDGVIYTRGEFRINGGGGGLNVSGGVWAGEKIRLNGNAHVAYNADYMAAIEGLSLEATAQVISWRELENPYQLAP